MSSIYRPRSGCFLLLSFWYVCIIVLLGFTTGVKKKNEGEWPEHTVSPFFSGHGFLAKTQSSPFMGTQTRQDKNSSSKAHGENRVIEAILLQRRIKSTEKTVHTPSSSFRRFSFSLRVRITGERDQIVYKNIQFIQLSNTYYIH